MCIFFFQAEDGIRDSSVTGVQTCALPISRVTGNWSDGSAQKSLLAALVQLGLVTDRTTAASAAGRPGGGTGPLALSGNRSEERRVGKEGRSRWSPYH